MVQQTFYHSLLRIASLTLAFVLIFESGLLYSGTKTLSLNTHQYLASAIGIQATVTPNEINQLTAELTSLKQQLNERDATVSQRAIAVGLNTGGDGSQDMSTFILSIILFLLLVLILLNYLLDYLRQLRPKQVSSTS